MRFVAEVPFWVLALSYWLHLLSTVVWLGGLSLMALIAWPAVRVRLMEARLWASLQQRFTPWANASVVVLWVTGFVQMTADTNYEGFLVVNSTWSQAILIKHIAVLAMMAIGLYIQWRLHPALSRLTLLEKQRPKTAAAQRQEIAEREARLLRLNLVCAAAVLFFTAVATAV